MNKSPGSSWSLKRAWLRLMMSRARLKEQKATLRRLRAEARLKEFESE